MLNFDHADDATSGAYELGASASPLARELNYDSPVSEDATRLCRRSRARGAVGAGHLVHALLLGLCAAALGGCSDTVSGVVPVGGVEPSDAQLERFVRRLHLDVTASAADTTFLDETVQRLAASGNSSAIRVELADELLATEAQANAFIEDLENRAFGGESLDGRYQFQCRIIRDNDPQCRTCGPAPSDNACGNCACALLTTLDAERTQIFAAVGGLAAGETTSSDVDRAVAESLIFRSTFGSGQAIAAALFEGFLRRPAEGEEITNAARMAQGSALGPQFPAGLLFLRHGRDYADLIDIVFESEAYREATVSGAFFRLLGRAPTADELVHFVSRLDAANPDETVVVRAIAGSREYFDL